MNINKITYKTVKYLNRNSSTILTIFSVAGVITTTVMAVKATPKVVHILESEAYERKEPLTTLETVRLAVPHYIPSALMGLGTITCIIGSNVLNQRYQKSLIGAYTLLDQSYKSYRKSANEVFGDDADDRIRANIARKSYVSSDGYAIYDPDTDDSDQVLFYDYYSEQYFKSTMSAVLNAQYHINRNFMLRGEVEINEFYEFLGLDPIPFGDHIGWGEEFLDSGMMWIDFENKLTRFDDDLECYIISTSYEPDLLYDEDRLYPR
ncbi:MAG: DUF6353 family protein [Vallitaleaceae bacterium]|nr:DUF6353 family protein [Vallitaleaceae bacterium]